MKNKGVFYLSVLFFFSLMSCVRNECRVTSPDGSLSMELGVREGVLSYRIFKDTTLVLDYSDMCWSVSGIQYGSRVEEIKVQDKSRETVSYEVLGGHAFAEEQYHRVLYKIVSDTFPESFLEVRAFNGGIAFRYLKPGKDTVSIGDFTEFSLPAETKVWLQGNVRYYEGDYQLYDVSALSEGQLAGPPVVLKYPDQDFYAAITESDLSNFAGMSLEVTEQGTFRSRLDGATVLSGDIHTPWRVVLVGSLNDLVNNDEITALSDSASPELFEHSESWLHPGKCVWSWLTGTGVSFENMKKFSALAGELGIEYNLVDEGWSSWQEGEKDGWALMKELVDYSSERGVKIWAWKAYPDRNGIPGIQTPERRAAFFQKCKETGIVGLKIDFFDSESQEITKYYQETLEEAARYGLMINFHGCNKPTGLNRSYPNEMCREGIKGYEYGVSTDCNVTLPFTRLLAGHGDATPLMMNPGQMNGTTMAHQLASAVVYSSPLLCLAAHPEEIAQSPNRDFIVSMPVVWDETVVLPPSEIGELVLFARRSGDVWYVAGMTKAPQDFELALSFLDNKKQYRVLSVMDVAEQPCLTANEEDTVEGGERLAVRMNARGGFVAKISPL